jgi:predicted RNA methylase
VKVKEYRRQFNLENTKYFNRNNFIKILKEDFELYLNNLGKMNPNKWKNAVSDIRRKYDRIMVDTKLSKEEKELIRIMEEEDWSEYGLII